jgi:hypothetical protein
MVSRHICWQLELGTCTPGVHELPTLIFLLDLFLLARLRTFLLLICDLLPMCPFHLLFHSHYQSVLNRKLLDKLLVLLSLLVSPTFCSQTQRAVPYNLLNHVLSFYVTTTQTNGTFSLVQILEFYPFIPIHSHPMFPSPEHTPHLNISC